jgi:hypothetical protein
MGTQITTAPSQINLGGINSAIVYDDGVGFPLENIDTLITPYNSTYQIECSYTLIKVSLRMEDSNTGNIMEISAPAGMSSSIEWILPGDGPSTGQIFYCKDGSLNLLEWSSSLRIDDTLQQALCVNIITQNITVDQQIFLASQGVNGSTGTATINSASGSVVYILGINALGMTLNLPSGIDGMIYEIKDISGNGSRGVTLTPHAGQSVEIGAGITANYGFVKIIYNSTYSTWYKIG